MYIWNKVLLGLIFVATIPFIIFAAQTLKTHAYWRKAYNAHEERIAALSKENKELEEGTDAEMGVRRLKLELHKQMMDRGRIWFGCVVQQVQPQTGAMVVKTSRPKPHGITKQSVLYAISQIPVQIQKDRLVGYLGEFQVTEVGNDVLTLVPAMKLGAQEIQRLQMMVRKPILLYDILPYDNHEAFAGLTDAQINDLLKFASEATREQYLKDGKKAGADDPQNVEIEGVVVRRRRDDEGNYLRQLNDYDILFQSHHAQLSLLTALTEGAKRDNKYISTALADAKVQVQFREKEKAELEAKKKELTRQRDIVATHQKQLEDQLAEVEGQIKKTLASNEKVATELAQTQEAAARLIEKNVKSIAKGDSAR